MEEISGKFTLKKNTWTRTWITLPTRMYM